MNIKCHVKRGLILLIVCIMIIQFFAIRSLLDQRDQYLYQASAYARSYLLKLQQDISSTVVAYSMNDNERFQDCYQDLQSTCYNYIAYSEFTFRFDQKLNDEYSFTAQWISKFCYTVTTQNVTIQQFDSSYFSQVLSVISNQSGESFREQLYAIQQALIAENNTQ